MRTTPYILSRCMCEKSFAVFSFCHIVMYSSPSWYTLPTLRQRFAQHFFSFAFFCRCFGLLRTRPYGWVLPSLGACAWVAIRVPCSWPQSPAAPREKAVSPQHCTVAGIRDIRTGLHGHWYRGGAEFRSHLLPVLYLLGS